MVTTSSIFHNLCWTFFENLLGSIFYALLFAISVSKFGSSMDSPLIEKIISVASNKTLGYKSLGMSGLITMFVNALLCNWMVTMGAVMNFTSKATIGKIGRASCRERVG